MLKTVKHYEMADDLEPKTLEKLGFLNFSNKYSKCINLFEDIELYVNIMVNEDGSLSFEDYENIDVIDDEYGQYYSPFYESRKPFHYLEIIVLRYNEEMDKLVQAGVFKNIPLEDLEINEPMKRTLRKRDE